MRSVVKYRQLELRRGSDRGVGRGGEAEDASQDEDVSGRYS